ncbi:MAG: hypothetical protein RTU30_06245 [Candidatus Thorarchaeota archaeon]
MTTLTIDQLEKWYRKQLSKRSKDFVKQAERSYKIVEQALKDIGEISQNLKEAADDDEPDSLGIATRFAMKINEVVESFYVTKDITHESTESLQNEINRFIQELWGAGSRWIRRMDKKHKNTVKQLDVYMKELSREVKRLGKLLFEFSWLKDLERIGSRIKTLQELSFSAEIFEEQIRTARLKIDQAKAENDTAERTYKEFTATSNVAELLNLDEEAERVASLLRMKLNPLKKQVKKFLQRDTGIRIEPAGQKALLEYFEDPYTAIAEEPDGYPGLIAGLDGLKQAIDTGKLSLKDRLARRALEEIDAMKRGSLKEWQEKVKDMEEKRNEFAGSDVYTRNAELEGALRESEKNLDYHTNDMLRIRDDILRQLERVKDHRERIEAEILETFEEKVQLQLDISLEPLLELCKVE